MHLVGAASDGTVTAIALSTGGSMGARSKLVIMQGEHVWGTRSIPRQVGGPAVLGGMVFVPNNRVHVSVSDSHGNELARVQVREDVASQAFAFDNDVYFGLLGIYRVDDETKKGASGGAHYFRLNLQERLPGAPAFLPNTADPPPALNSAVHRVSLSFLPEMHGETLGLLNDAVYLSFYRQLYSLDPQHLARSLGLPDQERYGGPTLRAQRRDHRGRERQGERPRPEWLRAVERGHGRAPRGSARTSHGFAAGDGR